MPLDLDDGFSIEAETEPVAGATVKYRYRPALWPAITECTRAFGTAGEVAATSKLLVEHVVSWDVLLKGKPVSVADGVKLLPAPILNQIYTAVATWAPKQQADSEGNSEPGSA